MRVAEGSCRKKFWDDLVGDLADTYRTFALAQCKTLYKYHYRLAIPNCVGSPYLNQMLAGDETRSSVMECPTQVSTPERGIQIRAPYPK